ncbi:protein RKD1-like [Lactuca sativa]|uniref:protein RKD1-like n=1 Tax=Lactuca sativa TaxID=4236 RepID=UPI0022AF8C6A|nr:protein RKD1-like [Lactuca sativa]
MISDNKEKMEFSTELTQMTNPRTMEKESVENGNDGASSYTSQMSLSRENITKYFYMLIKQATMELNVGTTLLKKHCRDLGNRRWPRRKLMRLQTLINNVKCSINIMQQELSKESDDGVEKKMKEVILVL